jgi:hypothetical protein
LSGALGTIVSASTLSVGAMITGTRGSDGAIASVGFSVPANVEIIAVTANGTSGIQNEVYQIIAESINGFRAYGVDSDSNSTVYFAQNEQWIGSVGMDAIPPAANTGNIDNFIGQPCGGSPNANWTVLQ